MASEKTDAIVVRLVNWSESSCILTLLTRDFGVISAVAKGAHRLNGPFESALDLLAVCRIVFIAKSSDALDILTEAKLTRRFRSGSRDLLRLYVGYYLAELIHALVEPGPTTTELFELTEQTLLLLDEAQPIHATLLQWELQLLRLLGYLPSLQVCACCGGEVPPQTSHPFAIMAGGLVCDTCLPGQRMVIRMQRESLQCMHHLAEPNWLHRPIPEVPRPIRAELRGCIQRYLTATFDRPFRLPSFLEDLAH